MRIFFLRSNSFLLRQLEIYSIFTIIEMSLRKEKKTKTDLNNLNKSHKTVTIYITTIFVISWKLVCNIFIYLYCVWQTLLYWHVGYIMLKGFLLLCKRPRDGAQVLLNTQEIPLQRCKNYWETIPQSYMHVYNIETCDVHMKN